MRAPFYETQLWLPQTREAIADPGALALRRHLPFNLNPVLAPANSSCGIWHPEHTWADTLAPFFFLKKQISSPRCCGVVASRIKCTRERNLAVCPVCHKSRGQDNV
uniref:Uncharacterized protein n=1 Tax=Sphaerodactylus townsendi TaxID=933632 RepID=A0ACB8F2D0_9SAUR